MHTKLNTGICLRTALFALFCYGRLFAVDSVGTSTADECSGGWVTSTPTFHVGAWITPNISNLQVDSGWIGIGDDYDDYDSALMIIYDNSSKTPNNLLAVSDTVIVSVAPTCEMLKVYFAQQSIVSNDSIWIGVYLFGLADRGKVGVSGNSGQQVYYSIDNNSIDDPWDTENDIYDANWYKPSVRIYLSVAGEQKLPPRRRRMFLGGF